MDVGGYSSGGLRFRHIQSPDYSGLFAFLGYRKADHGNAIGSPISPGQFRYLTTVNLWQGRLGAAQGFSVALAWLAAGSVEEDAAA